jgi:hypothetical protein
VVGTAIVSVITAVLVAVALIRIAWMQRGTARAIATLRDYERRLKAAATHVTVGGTLGTGRRCFHVVELVSTGFDLRTAEGTSVAVAAGVRVDLFASAVQLDGDVVSVSAGTQLRFLPPDVAVDNGPYQSPGKLAYTRGDQLMLFAPDAVLFGSPSRQRRTSIVRMLVFAAITAVTITMSVLEGPDTRWNALLFAVMIAVGIDQLAMRGVASWHACTRPPR